MDTDSNSHRAPSSREETTILPTIAVAATSELTRLADQTNLFEFVCTRVGVYFNERFQSMFDDPSSAQASEAHIRSIVTRALESLAKHQNADALAELAKIRIVFESVALLSIVDDIGAREALSQNLSDLQSSFRLLGDEVFTSTLAETAWELDAQFHQRIFLSLGCDSLAQLVDQISDACRNSGKPKSEDQLRRAIEEHDAIILGVESRDISRIISAVEDHVTQSLGRWSYGPESMDALNSFFEVNRDYFMALKLFEHDLPMLISRYPNYWVAYSANGQLSLARSEARVLKVLRKQKLRKMDCCIRCLSRDALEDVDVVIGGSSK